MKTPARWREFLPHNKVSTFLNIILKGYGTTLMCSNRVTGLFVFLAILLISPVTCWLTLIGVISATLTAHWIGARSSYIHSGCYSFNGVVLGIAWPCFLQINAISIMTLSFICAGSSVIMKYCLDYSCRTRSNLPVLSIPSVILIWLIYALAVALPSGQLLRGPDQSIVEYTQSYQSGVLRLHNKQWTNLTINMYWDTFKIHFLAVVFIAVGLFRHSRISAGVALAMTVLTAVLVYLLGGMNEFAQIDEYLYNTVPCGLALGGAFLVLNRRVWLLILGNLLLIVLIIYMGFHIFHFSVFIAPFNFFTILSLWLVKKNILKKEDGFYAVPMELIFSPETAEEWRKGEIYAQNYWKDIETSWSLKPIV